jgi:hypothetical protein
VTDSAEVLRSESDSPEAVSPHRFRTDYARCWKVELSSRRGGTALGNPQRA